MKARFIKSATAPNHYPPPDAPEIAFVGRSNVGKSSLINALARQTGLARTSSTPGRTRLVNWFELEVSSSERIAFVDLPGYGYAKVSKSERAAWRPMVESYFLRRKILAAVVLLIDARRSVSDEERDLIAWFSSENPEADIIIVLTKVDKLAKSKRKLAQLAAKKDLGSKRLPLTASTLDKGGVDDVWKAIRRAAKSRR